MDIAGADGRDSSTPLEMKREMPVVQWRTAYRQDVFSLPAISLPLVGNKNSSLQNLGVSIISSKYGTDLCCFKKFGREFPNARIGHFWQPVADMLGASREATGCHCWVRIFAILHLRLPSLLMLVLCHHL